MKKFRKTIAGILALALVASGLPAQFGGGLFRGFTVESSAVNVTEVATAEEFLTAVENGGSVKLTADFTLTLNEDLGFYKSMTLDLNGHVITGQGDNRSWNLCSSLIIRDGQGGGKIIIPASSYAILLCTNGSLTLESGTLEFTEPDNDGIDVNNRQFTMTGGTISSAGYSIWPDGGAVTISGGTIIGEFEESSGDLNITGGSFSFDPSDLLTGENTATKVGDYWVVNAGSAELEPEPDAESSYTITIPSALTVENSGWNATDGISATGSLADGKKLTVSAASANNWALKQQDGNETVGYMLATTSEDTEAVTSWEFTELSSTADTQPMGIIVDDYSGMPAGDYSDIVTFTAKVEDIQAQPRTVIWTGDDFSGSVNVSKDGITLTSANAHTANCFYDRGTNTFTAPSGMKFTKIEIICTYYTGGWNGATSEVIDRYQPDPDLMPDYWENIYKVTWTGSSSETSFQSSIYGVSTIAFYIEPVGASVPVTGITLNKTSTSIVNGSYEILSVTAVTPDDATDKTVTWSSDKESVATVDADGKVTAVAAGTANITATANGGSDVTATCAVTVTPATRTMTISKTDLVSGTSFTKDGVTISAEEIDSSHKKITGPGSFSTTLGNFTKIQVSASDISGLAGTGWTSSSTSGVWTGSSSSVSFSGTIDGRSRILSITFTIELAD